MLTELKDSSFENRIEELNEVNKNKAIKPQHEKET